MATLVQTTSVGSADFANATVTFSSAVTAGNVIIVYGAVEEFGTPAPALSSNRGDTFVTTSQNNNNNAAVLARVDSAVGGSTTITLTGGSFHRLVAQEWSGMTYDATAGTGTATAIGTITATTPGSATAASTSFSTWAVRTGDSYAAQTVPTGYTEAGRFVAIARGKFIGAYRAETTSGAKSAQWVDPVVNEAGDARAAIIFNFADAVSGVTLAADGGTFTYTGGDAGIQYGRQLAADGGSCAFTGGDAALTVGRQVAADGASYAYTGGDADFVLTQPGQFELLAEGGAFAFSGGDAGLTVSRTFAADGAAYAFAGGDAGLELGARLLAAEGGVFAFTGGEAILSYSGQTPVRTFPLQGAGQTYPIRAAQTYPLRR